MQANLNVFVEWDEGATEIGVWCVACALPSAVVLHFVGLTTKGLMPVATRTVCTNCDPDLFDPDDEEAR